MLGAVTLSAAVLALASTLAGIPLSVPGQGVGAEDPVSQDWSRDGWDGHEPGLSPAVVSGKGFGQVFETPVNGQVYAQPLSVGGSVLVATENDYVYSINRDTGTVNWSRQLGSPWATTSASCGSRVPIGPY